MYEDIILEQRIDRLEELQERLTTDTNRAINILTKTVNRLSIEMKDFKDEMKEFKDEMKEFKDEMKVFKDEMKVFKDEMNEYKDTSEKRSREADSRMDSFKAEMKEEHRKMNKQWGELANKMGTVVEDIVAPAVRPAILKYFNSEVNDFMVNRRCKNKELNLFGEFDVIAVCDDKVFLVETKTSPNKEKLHEFIDNLEKFKKLFPEYNSKQLIPIFASLRFEESFIPLANELNVYLLAYREWDYMDILNFNDIEELCPNYSIAKN